MRRCRQLPWAINSVLTIVVSTNLDVRHVELSHRQRLHIDVVCVENLRRQLWYLEILRADADRSLLVIAGAVPGARNGIVVVRKA